MYIHACLIHLNNTDPPGGALISQLTTGIILIGQDVRMNCSVKNLGKTF